MEITTARTAADARCGVGPFHFKIRLHFKVRRQILTAYSRRDSRPAMTA